MDAKITLTYNSEDEAKAIAESVSPDNLEAPKGLVVETKSLGHQVVTIIRYEGESIATFLSTIDDLLSCIGAAEKTILAIKEKI